MTGNFTVISNEDALLFQRLQRFFSEVKELTINHDVLEDNAVVYPRDLGDALSRVDPHWAEPK
jgi:hypothetical protein